MLITWSLTQISDSLFIIVLQTWLIVEKVWFVLLSYEIQALETLCQPLHSVCFSGLEWRYSLFTEHASRLIPVLL